MRMTSSWPAGVLAFVAVPLAMATPQPLTAETVDAALHVARDAPGRLVLTHWPGRGWIVRQDGRQVEIEFPGVAMAVRPPELPAGQAAFRSLAVTTSPAATYLHIALGCDCTVAIREDGKQLEIDAMGVDLAAGPTNRGSGPAPRLAPVPPNRPLDRSPGASASTRPAHSTGAGPVPEFVAGAADPSADTPQSPARPPAKSRPGTSGNRSGHAHGGMPVDLEATRDRLLGELRDAAESGLISFREDLGQTAVAEPVGKRAGSATGGSPAVALDQAGSGHHQMTGPPNLEEPDRATMASAVPMSRPASVPRREPGEGIEGSHPQPTVGGSGAVPGEVAVAEVATRDPSPGGSDGGAGTSDPSAGRAEDAGGITSPTLAATGLGCLPNETFMLPDPLAPDDLVREIAVLRQALTGEFDRPDPGAVAGLARLYIANGLGVEASRLIEGIGTEVADRNLLLALAVLSEDRPLTERSILAVPGCSGQHALWQAFDAALAGRSAEALALEAAAVGALEQAARGVRGRIAARIGLAAAAEGDRGATHRLLAMARRGVEPDNGPGYEVLQLLAAEDDRLFGRPAERLDKLAQLSRGRSEVSAVALLAIAADLEDSDSGTGSPADAALMDRVRLDLGGLALTARGSSRGEAAFLGEVRLTVKTLGRDAALELLEHGRRDGSLSETAYRSALLDMADLAAAPGDTELALIYEAAPGRFAASLAERSFRRALARSYAVLGAPSLAQSVLREGDLEDPAVAEGLARAFLAAGEGDRARDIAALIPGDAARAAVSAEAARLAGDPAAALPALLAARAPAAQRASAAWSIPDWEEALAALREQGASLSGGSAPRTSPLSEAARLGFAALQAGRTEAPEEARRLLEANPELAASLDAMFAPFELGAEAAPAEVPALLDRLRDENRLLEALLDDG